MLEVGTTLFTQPRPNASDIVDLRQDTYVRVYEAAAKSRPQAAKSFLFTTARNLIIDRFRRQRIVAIDAVGDLESLNVLIDELSPEQRASAHQELRCLAQAIDRLPPQCREVVWMRRVDDLPQKEVAARLGVTQKTVEKHVMKGMQLLAEARFRTGTRADKSRGGIIRMPGSASANPEGRVACAGSDDEQS